MRRSIMAGALALGVLAWPTVPATAGGVATAAREAAEFVMKKLGGKAAQEGAEALAGRIASAAARHGDDVLAAVRKVGPRALSLADEAGENAPRLMRLLARHGDDAMRVAGHPQGMALLSRYGDDVAEVLIKHQGIAEPVLASLGTPAVKAMGAVGARGGRRLAILAQGGELAAIGRTPELLAVVARHGDRAMDFIWRHKAVLAGGAALTAFLAKPEPFLSGASQLVGTVAESTVKPAVVAAGNVAREAAGFVRWALTILLVALAVGIGLAVRSGVFKEPAVRAAVVAGWGQVKERLIARGPRC
jgi:hypothetical protein